MAQYRRRAQLCANTKMPEGLTEELRRRILDLPDNVKTSYLKEQVFSKYVSTDTDAPEVRRARAIFKWLCAERENEATNDRLTITPGDYYILPRVSLDKFLSFCRSLIVEIIGETAPVEALIGSFSGGASTSRPRTESHPASKYLGKAHVTASALDIFQDIVIPEVPGWMLDLTHFNSVEVVRGNVLFTVPKKTDIDRVACKEPDLNMFIQKGIGTYIRRRLHRIGINLNDQSINRSLAREGSITGKLATFDLSNASDSVTTELVFQLLPECWFTLLNSVRSPVTIIDGDEHLNQMFSSMGNGFTFELESLLFYVLTRAICFYTGTTGVVSIYGDDIICPSGIANVLPFVFQFFGFQVNLEKSFVSGPFRESCGGHYHDGYDITPFYVKKPITHLTDVIEIGNKVRRWALMGPDCTILNPEVESLWAWLRDLVPSRFWGGDDTNSITSLVSNHVGTHRLVEETKSKSTGDGGYYHWLNAAWDRSRVYDGIKTSSRTDSQKRFRSRKRRSATVPRLPALFYHEIVLTPSMGRCEPPTSD